MGTDIAASKSHKHFWSFSAVHRILHPFSIARAETYICRRDKVDFGGRQSDRFYDNYVSLPENITKRTKNVIILKQTGIKAKRIAEHLFVGETFVKKILKVYEDTGGVTDIPRRKGKPRKITGNFMTDFHRKAFEVYL
jgi:hypothetical protein